jgi:hypothetical protein
VVEFAKDSPLRPELLESTYHLHRATGSPFYLQAGKEMFFSLQVPVGRLSRTPWNTLQVGGTLPPFLFFSRRCGPGGRRADGTATRCRCSHGEGLCEGRGSARDRNWQAVVLTMFFALPKSRDGPSLRAGTDHLCTHCHPLRTRPPSLPVARSLSPRWTRPPCPLPLPPAPCPCPCPCPGPCPLPPAPCLPLPPAPAPALQNHSRVECGYASVADVRTNRLDDRMDRWVRLCCTDRWVRLCCTDRGVRVAEGALPCHGLPRTAAHGRRLHWVRASERVSE